MSDQTRDLSGLERVESAHGGFDSPESPMVSVRAGGAFLGFLKHAYEELGKPAYVSFYQSQQKVFILPSSDGEDVTNPHMVTDKNNGTQTSFAWHDFEGTGRAPLRYDDERNVHYFDTEEVGDE